MSHAVSSRSFWPIVALALVACSGEGSDVGPSLVDLPTASCKVLVRDDGNRAVSAARVAVAGATAVTGRQGRGELFVNPLGSTIVRVDARAATASASDRLASLGAALTIVNADLPSVLYLPDTASSAEATIPTGSGQPPTTIDDSARTGAILQLGNGTIVNDGGAASVTLRLGELAREHLPSALPSAPAGAWLTTRGFWIDPPTATFAPAGTLQVPDELALGGGNGVLFRLDPSTGEWGQVSGSASSSGGTLQLAGAITGGGLYVYAVDRPIAIVRGRVVDTLARPVFGTYVRADSAPTLTVSDGTFSVLVAGSDGSGAARTIEIELLGGAQWLGTSLSVTSPLLGSGADVGVGDLQLETVPVTNIRVQSIRRGRGEVGRRIASNTALAAVAATGYTDINGQCLLEDIGSGYIGFMAGFPFDVSRVFISENLTLVRPGRRWQDTFAFYDDRGWFVGGRSTRTIAVDSIGTGPVQNAAIVRGRTASEGFVGVTRESGVLFVGRDFSGRATATIRTEHAGLATVSAFTLEQPNGDHLELPLVRQQLVVAGAFDRHGTIAGDLTGFNPARTQQLYASRPLEIDEWFDQRFFDVAPRNVVPARLGGAQPAGTFRAGIALPQGHVAVAEGAVNSGVFTLTGVGVLLDQVVPQGTLVARNVPIDRPATTAFVAPGALTDFDGAFTAADLRFDLALQQPSGRIADVARAVGGNMTVSGANVTFTLPALTGALAGHAWLVALRAQVSTATTATAQRTLLRLAPSDQLVVPQLPLPTLTAPLDGATVPALGFAVDFTLPAGSMYATIDLRSDGTEARLWTAVVPPTATQFQYVALPTQAQSPLVAGRTYTLTLTSYRADTGFLLGRTETYRDLVTYWVTIGAAERGVRAASSRTITITAN